jgi:hypothetical protein
MVDVNNKEGKMAVPFGFHSELNVPMGTTQVVTELRHWTLGPDDKHVIQVVNLAEGLVVCPLQGPFFKVFHEEVGDDRGLQQTHGHTPSLLTELLVESEKGKGEYTAEESLDAVPKVLAQKAQDLSHGHHSEKRDNVKAIKDVLRTSTEKLDDADKHHGVHMVWEQFHTFPKQFCQVLSQAFGWCADVVDDGLRETPSYGFPGACIV